MATAMPNDPDAALAHAAEKAHQAEVEVAVGDQAMEDAKVRERFRGRIALFVIWLFITVIIAAVVYAIAQSDDASSEIDGLLRDYVYPVVLLVLGFYFGARVGESIEVDD